MEGGSSSRRHSDRLRAPELDHRNAELTAASDGVRSELTDLLAALGSVGAGRDDGASSPGAPRGAAQARTTPIAPAAWAQLVEAGTQCGQSRAGSGVGAGPGGAGSGAGGSGAGAGGRAGVGAGPGGAGLGCGVGRGSGSGGEATFSDCALIRCSCLSSSRWVSGSLLWILLCCGFLPRVPLEPSPTHPRGRSAGAAGAEAERTHPGGADRARAGRRASVGAGEGHEVCSCPLNILIMLWGESSPNMCS